MNKEKQEQLKIALLGIIAVVLIVQTGMIMTSKNNADIGSRSAGINTQVQGGQKAASIPSNPGQQSITFPANPGQQSVSVPINLGQPATPTTTMTFEQTDVDIGTVNAGTKTSHTFKFTNTGDLPLTLNNVNGDAGATVISWPTEPIPQGETGEITVEFGGDIPAGFQQKTIHVSANTEPAHSHLTIKANVK